MEHNRADGTVTIGANPAQAPARRWPYLGPLAIFAIVGVFLGVGLTLNPREIPSPLIGKPVPQFQLAAVRERTLGLASSDLRGEVSIVNVFASWCVACREEHPLWMTLARQNIAPVHGLNYKDKPDEAKAWLKQFGDPYLLSATDLDGRVGIDYGVYGVPETFLIDKQGVIRYKQIGPVTPEKLEKTILPLVRELQK